MTDNGNGIQLDTCPESVAEIQLDLRRMNLMENVQLFLHQM